MHTRQQSSRQKMHNYRARLKQAGMRSVQIWVPDTRSAAMAAELRRQSLLVSAGPDEAPVMDFLENVGADWGDK